MFEIFAHFWPILSCRHFPVFDHRVTSKVSCDIQEVSHDIQEVSCDRKEVLRNIQEVSHDIQKGPRNIQKVPRDIHKVSCDHPTSNMCHFLKNKHLEFLISNSISEKVSRLLEALQTQKIFKTPNKYLELSQKYF